MVCPSCGSPNAYVGLTVVECDNHKCKYHIGEKAIGFVHLYWDFEPPATFTEPAFAGYAPIPLTDSNRNSPKVWTHCGKNNVTIKGYFVSTPEGEPVFYSALKGGSRILRPGGTIEVDIGE